MAPPFKPGISGNPSGRPLGSKNRVQSNVREMFSEALDRAGGKEMVFKFAKRHPKEFLALAVRLEPRLLQGDIDVDMQVNVPGVVRVIIPTNYRCDPALLGDRVHRETPSEHAMRVFERAAHNICSALAASGRAADARIRRQWADELLAAARDALEEQQHVVEVGGEETD